jgi:hypothetical protein
MTPNKKHSHKIPTPGMPKKRLKHIVVLNKADLISREEGLRILKVMDKLGKPAILASADDHSGISKIRDFALSHVDIRYRTVGCWMMVCGLPNVGKSTTVNGLKQLAFNQAKYAGLEMKYLKGEIDQSLPASEKRQALLQRIKSTSRIKALLRDVSRSQARCNMQPGSTKHLGNFQVGNYLILGK